VSEEKREGGKRGGESKYKGRELGLTLMGVAKWKSLAAG